MGQYFQLRNATRREGVSLPGPMKAIERMTNAKCGAIVMYLLLDGPVDGTGPLLRAVGERLYEQHDFEDEEVAYDLYQQIKGGYYESEAELRSSFVSDYEEHVVNPDDNSHRSPQIFARLLASHTVISDVTEYGGRWAGDEVVLIGDYSDSMYSHLYHVEDDPDYEDITDGVIGEINWFTDGWLDDDDQSPLMAPDMVFTM